MADNINYIPSISVKGLNTDFKIDSLPEGEYPYALNAVSRDNLQFLTNDLGNELCIELDGNILGSLYINYDTYILFLDNNKIIKLNVNTCNYDVILELPCLNFSILHQIQAAYTVLDDCNQLIIYWTDNVNPIRYYNIDTNESITDCNELSLNTCNVIPTFTNISVLNSGGTLKTGTYQFVVSFGKIKDNNTPLYTNWYNISNPVSIYDDDMSGPFWAIDGAYAGTDTNKAIYLNISNLPSIYSIIRIAVIITINQIVNVKLINSSNYTPDIFEFVYSGNSEQDVNIEIAEVTTNKASYLKAKDLIIKDNRLLIANLKTIKNVNYQKYANNITVDYYTEKVRIDVEPFAYKNPDFILSHKSWMRDEVYALGIVWEFCDGSYSRAFHIPGREKTCFDYRLDENNIQINSDLEGHPLCDDYIIDDDANAINCDLEKWKNRNTAVRTEYTGCFDGYQINLPLILDTNGTLLCSGCVQAGEHVICDGATSCASTIYGPISGDCIEALTVYTSQWTMFTLTDVDISMYGWVIVNETNEYIEWQGCWNENSELDLSTLPGNELDNKCNPVVKIDCIYSKGKMAYHESCERYPVIKDCNNDYMYPTELDDNNNVIGQYIRHHRMPDSTIEPHYTLGGTNNSYVETKETETISSNKTPYIDTYVYPLGINIENITLPDDIPSEMIKGYRIVYVKRTDNNKSVIAKGNLHGTFMDTDANNAFYLIPKHGINSYEYWANPGGGGQHAEPYNSVLLSDAKIIGGYTFISPNTSFVKPSLFGDYIKIEWEYFGRGDVYGDRDQWDNDDFCDGYNYGRRQNININQKEYSIVDNKWQINRLLKGLTYAGANEFVEAPSKFTFPLDNRNRESSVYLELKDQDLDNHLKLIHYRNEYQGDNPTFFGVIGANPIQDSDDSFYKISFVEGLPSATGNPVRQRLNAMGSSATHYVSIKRNDCSQYGRVENLFYINTGLRESINQDSLAPTFNIHGIYGDSFINYWAYRRTSRIGKDGENDEGYAGDAFKPKTLKTLVHSIVESDINVDLRHEGSLLKETYYPKLKNKSFALDSAVPNSAKPLNAYLPRFYYNECDKEVQDFADNYFAYNYDYSNVNDKMIYLPVDATYKTCDCISELPNTIAYSNKTNLNNFNLNSFLSENYLTVPSNYGVINNLFVLNNSLYAHTRDIIWKIFSNEKQLKLDENTVYIGQGDLFSKDPLTVYASNIGYAGNILQYGTLSTENGYYFYDIYGGKVHHFTDKLDDLSLKKMSNFFKNNSKFCLPLSNTDNYINPEGIGIFMIFDYYNNRLLLSKKDYDIKQPELYKGIYNENTAEANSIYQHPNNGMFLLTTDDPTEYSFISLKNSEYFCDKSFTISYSYNLDAWASFHSFVPDYFLYNRNNYYTVLDKKVYRHNVSCKYQNYYNSIVPFIVDFPVITKPSIMANTYTTLHWNSFAYECDDKCNQLFKNDISFNKLLLFNSRQSTGILDLNFSKGGYLRTEPTYPNVNFDRNERHFSLNNIRDYVDNYDLPMFISDCETLCNCDINKMFNNEIINPNKHYTQLQRLRDTYAIARFILDNKDNIKLVMDYLITTSKTSIR